MIMNLTNLVSAADLRRLTFGSFEHKIVQVRDSIITEVADKIKASPTDLALLATFEDRAVIQGPANKFYAAVLERSDDGVLHVVSVTEERVEVVDPSRLGEYVESEVDRAVDAWLGGDIKGAFEKIAELLPLVPSTADGDEEQVLGTLEAKVTTPYRSWRRVYEERKSHIHRFIVNHFEGIETGKLAAKYRKLYDGSISEDRLDGYEEIVESDLALVLRRYEQLLQTTAAAVERARPALATAKSSANATIQLYSGFAEDLIHDLAGVEKLAERATTRVGSVAGRGRMRDMLAEALHQYEVASRFVVEVADRLTQAA